MLSEIDLRGQTTKFLYDYKDSGDCEQTQDTVASSESTEPHEFPPCIVLYLLWKPGTYESAKTFVEVTIQKAVEKIINILDPPSDETGAAAGKEERMKKRGKKLYVVVDKIISSGASREDDEPGARKRRFQVQVQIAEQLARQTAVSPKLRLLVDGITVGLSDHPQAAPGLEACMEAILHGSKDRRKVKDEKSFIGIVCEDPDELLGIQEGAETDAVQGLLQSRSVAEWNGNGDIMSFAARAHTFWKKHYNFVEPPPRSDDSPRKSPRRRRKKRRGSETNSQLEAAEQVATWMVWIFFVVVIAHLWKIYGDDILNTLSQDP